MRGHPEHYDEWNNSVDGYGWDSWVPWFQRLETDLDLGDSDWHGAHGPIRISRYPWRSWWNLQERFHEAALSLGHEDVDDHNAPGAIGVARLPSANTHLATIALAERLAATLLTTPSGS